MSRETRAAKARQAARKGRVPTDATKIRAGGWSGPPIPEYYEDVSFTCRDCGRSEVWTATQQKWWHEVAGGLLETTAIRCRACRKAERARKDEARRVHAEGIEKKKAKGQT